MQICDTRGGQTCDLSANFDGFEKQMRRLLQEAGAWPRPALQLRPADRTWCALEVLDHLRRCSAVIAAQAEQQLALPTNRRVRCSVRRALLFAIMRSGLRVGVPKALPELHPCVPASFDAVAEDLLQVFDRLECLFRNLPLQQAKVPVFYHPIGGWMSPAAALDFLAVHARHHVHQLNRLKEQAESPCSRPGQHSVLLAA